MTQSKKTAAHYRARMTGLAAAMLAAAMGIAGAVPRRARSQRRDKAQSTKSPLALGPRPFPSLWNARPPRPGRQSPSPRRPGQRDTVTGDAAREGFERAPVLASVWRILPAIGGTCRKRASAPTQRYCGKPIVGRISAPRRRKIARRDRSLKSYVQDLIALAAAWRIHLYGITGFLADQGARRR
jgi:hypothetical protein